MRPYPLRLLSPAGIAALLLLAASSSSFADEGSDEAIKPDGQASITDAADPSPAKAKVLHSIPIDNMPLANAKGPDNQLIRDLVAARSSEDIIICVAGCFSGRDRVVYAQPMEAKPVKPIASNEPILADPEKTAALASAPAAKNPAAKKTSIASSSDPMAPAIINADDNRVSGTQSTPAPTASASSPASSAATN